MPTTTGAARSGVAPPPEAELAWLAGLIEGEGSFRNPNAVKNNRGMELTLGMIDKDVVERVQRITGVGKVRTDESFSRRDANWQTFYRWAAYGDNARWLLGLLFPYFGDRRSAKVLALAKANS